MEQKQAEAGKTMIANCEVGIVLTCFCSKKYSFPKILIFLNYVHLLILGS